MDYTQTGLPDKPVFREAFNAGWARYGARYGDEAAERYLRGPVAMAKLIFEHGGDCRQTATAACLAGPALFSDRPSDVMSSRLMKFSSEVRRLDVFASPESVYTVIPELSGDARLFFQASAILLLEQLAGTKEGTAENREAVYEQALRLYSAARGGQDTYKLDTRFEIAAMKVTMTHGNQPNIWAINRKPTAPAFA